MHDTPLFSPISPFGALYPHNSYTESMYKTTELQFADLRITNCELQITKSAVHEYAIYEITNPQSYCGERTFFCAPKLKHPISRRHSPRVCEGG